MEFQCQRCNDTGLVRMFNPSLINMMVTALPDHRDGTHAICSCLAGKKLLESFEESMRRAARNIKMMGTIINP